MVNKILIVAGEASSDLHAANLVKEIKALVPELEFFGLGGTKMEQQGVKIYTNIVDLAVIGFVEVLKNIRKFRSIFNQLLQEVDRLNPQLAILIDYPGFNLRMAKEVKIRDIPIIYYISPQVWAWDKQRINLIKKYVNKIIVLFRFEEELYNSYAVDVEFVGHPLLDIVKPGITQNEFLNKENLDRQKTTISLLPGSREKEVKTLLPIMLETARCIAQRLPDIQFLILKSASLEKTIFSQITGRYPNLRLRLIDSQTYEGLNISNLAIVASGTATLETTMLGVPMLIIYKVNFLTWAYIRQAIQIPYIGLVNVVAGKKIIPEFVQYQVRPRLIAREVIELLKNQQKLNQIKTELSKVRQTLGSPGASNRAARIILDFLQVRL